MNTFGVDENGIILTEVSRDYITPQFKPAVEDILKIIIQEFASELDGIFLYGSVVTGKAVAEKSDLDSILIFKNKVK